MDGDVLIVDDDLGMREILGSICEIIGTKYRVAFDGIDAQDKINQQTPGLIILDLMMPRLDGIGVLEWLKSCPFKEKMEWLKSCPFKEKIPVVLYTARYLSSDERKRIPLPDSMIHNKSALSFDQIREIINSVLPA
jgi:CheY-like chemotaxis protein